MKYILILLLVVTSSGYAQKENTKNNKEIALTLCNDFSKYYSKNNSYPNNRMIYIKNVEIQLVKYGQDKKEDILRKLHEFCPRFLEYSTIESKIKAENKGATDAFKLWDIFINSKNEIVWTAKEKQKFLDICNYALSERKNSKELCQCTIDEISKKLSAKYFLSLSTNEQGYLGGQVGYVYCSE